MKALFLEGPGGPLVVKETPIPEPGKGEVLVKIAAAPINPSDLARIKNAHLEQDMKTFIPGLEGSGTVVKAGPGILPRLWLGKRVVCAAHRPDSGTWAEYSVTTATSCFPLSSRVSDEQGSMSLVNPLTAIEFFDIVRAQKHKALINNAAASALGRMVEILGDRHGIPVINIVRKQQQAEMLKGLGSKHVLVSSDVDFVSRLAQLAYDLKATILFDSVCGRQLGDLLEAMPYGSSVVIYGNLSGEELPWFNPRTMLAKNLTISAFYLASKSRENGIIRNVLNLMKVSRLMQAGMTIKIHDRFPLEKAQEAVDFYLADMSAGKVLFVPA